MAVELLSLDGRNFRAWKTRVMRALKAEGLLDMVVPLDGQVRAKQGRHAEAQAEDIIKRSLSNEVLMFLPSYSSANDMWKYLAEAYTTQEELQALHKKLEALVYKDGDDLAEHSAKVKRLFVELSACGCPPDLSRQLELFSRTLPPQLGDVTAFAREQSRTFDQAVDIITRQLFPERTEEASGSKSRVEPEVKSSPGKGKPSEDKQNAGKNSKSSKSSKTGEENSKQLLLQQQQQQQQRNKSNERPWSSADTKNRSSPDAKNNRDNATKSNVKVNASSKLKGVICQYCYQEGHKESSCSSRKRDIAEADKRRVLADFPGLSNNPLSLARVTEAGYDVVFDAHGFRVLDSSDGQIVFGSY